MTQFLKTRTSTRHYPFDFLASTPWLTSSSRKAPSIQERPPPRLPPALSRPSQLPPPGFPTPPRPLLRCSASVRSSLRRHDVPTHNFSCHRHVSRPWLRLHEVYRRFWRRRDSWFRRHRLTRTRRPVLSTWPAVLPWQGLSTFNTHDLPQYRFGHRRNDVVTPRSMPLSSPRRRHPPPPAAIPAGSHVLRHSLRSSRPHFHVQPSHHASLTQLRSILLPHPWPQIKPTLVVPLSPNLQRRLHDQDQPLDQRHSLSVYRRLRHGFRRVFPGTTFPNPLSRSHLAALRAWHQHSRAPHDHCRLEGLHGLRFIVKCNSFCALNSGRSRTRAMQLCLREIWFLSARFDFVLFGDYLPGTSNTLADHLSRWHLCPTHNAQFQTLTVGLVTRQIPCPGELFDFEVHVWSPQDPPLSRPSPTFVRPFPHSGASWRTCSSRLTHPELCAISTPIGRSSSRSAGRTTSHHFQPPRPPSSPSSPICPARQYHSSSSSAISTQSGSCIHATASQATQQTASRSTSPQRVSSVSWALALTASTPWLSTCYIRYGTPSKSLQPFTPPYGPCFSSHSSPFPPPLPPPHLVISGTWHAVTSSLLQPGQCCA